MIGKSALNRVHAAAVMKRRVRVLASHLAQVIDGPSAILDVGCGDGAIAKAITILRPDVRVRGLDVFLRPSVAIAAEVFDGVTIPYPQQSHDYVTLVDVLHHTDDPAALLRESLRVARRGVIIKDHLVEGFGARPTLRFMDWVGNRGHDVALPYNYLDRATWLEIFRTIGCRAAAWNGHLNLYPPPFSLLFDRRLHFVARIERL